MTGNLKINIKRNEDLNKVENDFINRINEVYNQCVDYCTFGNSTEFYDEDNVVLMTATEEGNKIIFKFSSYGDSYEYQEVSNEVD